MKRLGLGILLFGIMTSSYASNIAEEGDDVYFKFSPHMSGINYGIPIIVEAVVERSTKKKVKSVGTKVWILIWLH